MTDLYCLDTYALIEIKNGNKNFAWLFDKPFFVPERTLCEFYGVIYREKGLEEAGFWAKKLEPFMKKTSFPALLSAVRFRQDNKKKRISFFDAVGYMTAIEQKALFVTGDKEFNGMPSVKYVK